MTNESVVPEDALDFVIVDVFTDRRFHGNPLAVVFDADSLDAGRMQDIAAEFGFSETAFVVRPHTATSRYGLRIFSPERELPFAGHPVLGAAYAMSATGRITPDDTEDASYGSVIHFVNDLALGSLAVELLYAASLEPDTESGLPAKVAMEQGAPSVGEILVDSLTAKIAAAVGLSPHEILAIPGPRVSTTGLPCLIVPVGDKTILSEATPQPMLLELLGSIGADLVYLFASDGDLDHYVARCFAPSLGVVEDAATGSAAGALGAYLHILGIAHADGVRHLWVRQGEELGRPSVIEVEVRDPSSGLAIWVGGECALVAEGRIFA